VTGNRLASAPGISLRVGQHREATRTERSDFSAFVLLTVVRRRSGLNFEE
jgi:hypothetical protein